MTYTSDMKHSMIPRLSFQTAIENNELKDELFSSGKFGNENIVKQIN